MYKFIDAHYRANRDRLVKRLTRGAGSHEAAEDIVQEGYTRALKYCETFDPSGNFDIWLSRILKNAMNHYKNMERKHPSDEEFDEELSEGIDCFSYSKVLLDRVKGEIYLYDPLTSEVLRLYFVHGYSPRSITKVVDLRYKNIERMIYEFKKDIRDKYGENLHC